MMREAVVLAGGFGTRLRTVVADVPKPMAPIGGRPFLELQLSLLERNGFDHVVLAVGYLGETIISHFGDRFGTLRISYNRERTPLGTGGAIAAGLRKCEKDGVFVLNGDTYLDLEFDEVDRLWNSSRRGVIVGIAVADTARYGRLTVHGGLVSGMAEKGTAGPGVINAGYYVLRREQFQGTGLEPPFSMEHDFLAARLPASPFDLFVTSGMFIDIGVPKDYERAQEVLARR